MPDQDKIVPIFKNVASLHRTLGMLEAALADRDEMGACRQLNRMFYEHDPADNAVQIAEEALKVIASWNDPYLTMNAASKILNIKNLPPSLINPCLSHYLDAAVSIADNAPVITMGACVFAHSFSINTPHETRIYMEAAAMCENSHPALASQLLKGAVQLYASAVESDIETFLKERILELIEDVAAYDDFCAIESYSCMLDLIPDTDEDFRPVMEKMFILCEKAATHSADIILPPLAQITRKADEQDPLHQRALSLHDKLMKLPTEVDYSKSEPLTPAEFLKRIKLPSP